MEAKQDQIYLAFGWDLRIKDGSGKCYFSQTTYLSMPIVRQVTRNRSLVQSTSGKFHTTYAQGMYYLPILTIKANRCWIRVNRIRGGGLDLSLLWEQSDSKLMMRLTPPAWSSPTSMKSPRVEFSWEES